MKVFLSWSGPRSKGVAEALYRWLPQVIQAIEPWLSSEMEKGRKWSPEVSDRLRDIRFGLLCLTRENLASPWLLFEAGALSKTPDAYVWTFLHGISPVDVEQPLAQFQHTVSEKADVRKLMHTINQVVREQNEKSLTESTLDKVFDTFWPELENNLKDLEYQGPQAAKELRTDRELLEELLELARSQEIRLNEVARSSSLVGSLNAKRQAAIEQEKQRTVLRIVVQLDVPEVSANRFVDELRDRLPPAEFELVLIPGTDRAIAATVRFARPIISSEGIVWRLLSRASEAAGLTIVSWHMEDSAL